jgi:hypothetical protein
MRVLRTLQEAEAFLSQIKDRIAEDGIVYTNGRGKNEQSLADLGISRRIQRQIIDSLQADDYCKGPEPDEKFNWKQVGVFGAVFNGADLYIKFSIGLDGTPVVCLSFHESEYPMRYQFK